MKKFAIIISVMLLVSIMLPVSALAGTVDIPDAKFATELRTLTGTSAGDPLTDTALNALGGTLDLSNKGIKDMTGIRYLKNVTVINLSKNKISKIPDEIGNLTQLVQLDLSLNSITSISRNIGKLSSLTHLDISGNKFSYLPSNVAELSNLTHLDISANRIYKLSSAMSKLNLTEFEYNYCFLDTSTGSDTVSTLDAAGGSSDGYDPQLLPVANLVTYSTEAGKLTIAWDAMETLDLGNGVTGTVQRFSVFDENTNEWLEGIPADQTSYTVSGLDPDKEYTYSISADYYLSGTRYDGNYIKCYKEITGRPFPQNTPTPSPTMTPTPEPATPTPEPVMTPTPELEPQNTPEATPMPQVTDASSNQNGSGGGINTLKLFITILVVLISLIIILVIVLLVKTVRSRPRRSRH